MAKVVGKQIDSKVNADGSFSVLYKPMTTIIKRFSVHIDKVLGDPMISISIVLVDTDNTPTKVLGETFTIPEVALNDEGYIDFVFDKAKFHVKHALADGLLDKLDERMKDLSKK